MLNGLGTPRQAVTQREREARGVCGGEGNWLVLGSPPWVTNGELGRLNSTNLPARSNVQGHRGLADVPRTWAYLCTHRE